MALADFDFVPDFGDPAAEARTCRSDCALFDFSFLECARLEGSDARAVIETFIGRSLSTLGESQICYALRVDADGHLVADLTIWRTGEASFEVMSGRREDIEDLLAYDCSRVSVTDLTLRSRSNLSSTLLSIAPALRTLTAGSAGLAIPAKPESKLS